MTDSNVSEKLWVVRNRSGELRSFDTFPFREEEEGIWAAYDNLSLITGSVMPDSSIFDDIEWKDSSPFLVSGMTKSVEETGGKKKLFDSVQKPEHYNRFSREVIDTIEEAVDSYPPKVIYHVGNAIKYIFRAPFKGRLVEDLKKAIWYLERAVGRLEKE